jgi:hypothetical protein
MKKISNAKKRRRQNKNSTEHEYNTENKNSTKTNSRKRKNSTHTTYLHVLCLRATVRRHALGRQRRVAVAYVNEGTVV